MAKNPNQAWTYLQFLADSAQNWDTSEGIDPVKQSSQAKGGGLYVLKESDDLCRDPGPRFSQSPGPATVVVHPTMINPQVSAVRIPHTLVEH